MVSLFKQIVGNGHEECDLFTIDRRKYHYDAFMRRLDVIGKIPQIIDGLVTAILGSIPQIIDAGVNLLISLIQNLRLAWILQS